MTTSAFGRALREWRRARGLTQLELALEARASQRHLSFLETGRSRPGADIVLRLANALDVPLRERNALLALAGLPPAYRDARDDASSAPFRAALRSILERHEPFPALVLDGWWDVVDQNEGAARLFTALGARPDNMVEGLLDTASLRDKIENWPAVAAAVLHRLRREQRASPFDDRLAALVARAEEAVEVEGVRLRDEPEDALVVSPTFLVGGAAIRTFSVISYFNAPRDVRLSELRVELLFPRDAEAETRLAALVDSG